ncbi:MAG: helicase, partial [Bacillota bacterium]
MAPAALAGLEYLLGLRPAADADAGDREGRGRAAVAAWFRLSPRTRALIAGLWPPGDPLSQWLKRHALAGPPGPPTAGAVAAAAREPAAAEERADALAGGSGAGGRDQTGSSDPAGGKDSGTGTAWLQELEEIFAPDGPLARLLPGYKPRPGQLQMARAVAAALAGGRHLAVEAGTGIGKTLAYLVPAVLWAHHHGCRVVVATHTIALQEQLRTRDLPLLHRLFPFAFRSAVLKGFAHYACRLQAEATFRVLAAPTSRAGEATRRAAARVAAWLEQTVTGDAGELDDPAVAALWSRFSTEPGACLGARCPAASRCFALLARERAQAADLVVTNHALVVADRASEHRVLPEYHGLIVDEAHHLEDVAAHQLGVRIRPADLARLLGAPSGATGESAPAGTGDLATVAPGEAAQAAAALREADGALRRWLEEHRPPDEPAVARLPVQWKEAAAGRELAAALERARESLGALLDRLALAPVPPGEAAFLAARRLRQNLQAATEAIQRCLEAEGWCRWIEAGPDGEPELAAAPVDASELLAPWFQETVVVLTSATLPRDARWPERLGVNEAARLEIPSPYDFRRQALLAVVTDAPRPPARPGEAYLDDLARRVGAVVGVVPGGVLVLFTARVVMSQVARRVRGPLARQGRRLAVQDE